MQFRKTHPQPKELASPRPLPTQPISEFYTLRRGPVEWEHTSKKVKTDKRRSRGSSISALLGYLGADRVSAFFLVFVLANFGSSSAMSRICWSISLWRCS